MSISPADRISVPRLWHHKNADVSRGGGFFAGVCLQSGIVLAGAVGTGRRRLVSLYIFSLRSKKEPFSHSGSRCHGDGAGSFWYWEKSPVIDTEMRYG